MYEFCPHCGESLHQEERPGQMLTCQHCKKDIGVIPVAKAPVVVDQTAALLQAGTVARCPVCQQLVPLRAGTLGAGKSIGPHQAKDPPRKICPGSGKPAEAAPAAAKPAQSPAPPGLVIGKKDLSAYATRDLIKVVACQKDAAPTIEALTLDYLDKKDRVRLQIEALRDILGSAFQMRDYPPALRQPQLAVWSNAAGCVVAKKHPQGGYQTLSDAEVQQVVADLQQSKQQFFA